jgi:hypothetical protein
VGDWLLLLVDSGEQVVDDFIKEILDVGAGLGGHLAVVLRLFLRQFLGHPAGLTEDFVFEVALVADDVDLDVLLAGLADEVDPLGDALGGGQV